MAAETEPDASEAASDLPEQLLALPLPRFLAECEARYLEKVLAATGGNQRAAADHRAGVPTDTFHKKVRRHGIQVEVVEVRITRDAGGR
jgi:transcriptional regulator of acetoin/glycerol metabolism